MCLQRTLEIAERCNLKLEKVENRFPNFDVPPGYTLDSYFEHVTREGFARRHEAAGPRGSRQAEASALLTTSSGWHANSASFSRCSSPDTS